MKNVSQIRQMIIDRYLDQDFVVDRTGAKTIEIIGESFIVDEDWVVRKPNKDYIDRELTWYISKSLYVDDIPGETPQILSLIHI